MITRGPDSKWRIHPDMGLPQQRPVTTPQEWSQLEADLAPEGMRYLYVSLLCFRQGQKDVESSTTSHKGTPAAEQIEFLHWMLWIHNHHRHHCNSNQSWIISFHITLKVKWNVKIKVIEKAPSTSFYWRINLNNSENEQTIWSQCLVDARSLIEF